MKCKYLVLVSNLLIYIVSCGAAKENSTSALGAATHQSVIKVTGSDANKLFEKLQLNGLESIATFSEAKMLASDVQCSFDWEPRVSANIPGCSFTDVVSGKSVGSGNTLAAETYAIFQKIGLREAGTARHHFVKAKSIVCAQDLLDSARKVSCVIKK